MGNLIIFGGITETVSSEPVWSAVGAALVFAIGWAIKFADKKWKLSQAEKELAEAFSAAVHATHDELGKKMRATVSEGSPEGKLSQDQKDELKDYAWERVKKIAKGQALKLALGMAKERVGDIIANIVKKKKAKPNA